MEAGQSQFDEEETCLDQDAQMGDVARGVEMETRKLGLDAIEEVRFYGPFCIHSRTNVSPHSDRSGGPSPWRRSLVSEVQTC